MGRTSGWHASWDGYCRVSGQRSDICDADRGGFQGHRDADWAGGASLSRLSYGLDYHYRSLFYILCKNAKS